MSMRIAMALLIGGLGCVACVGQVEVETGPADVAESGPDFLGPARAGGAYLVRMTEADGRFVYDYDPHRDRENVVAYNMLRHAGSIYAMCELYEVAPDPALRAAIARAIGFMKQRIRPYQQRPDQAVLLDRFEKIKLGGNALGILALVQHARITGERGDLEVMRQLARWMLSTQTPAGEFTPHIIDVETNKPDDHVSAYYPGEAILALLRLHDLDPDPAWLDAAERAARWLIEVRDRDRPIEDLPHDHWLLYGLNELHRKRPDALWLDHAAKLVEAILRTQHGADAPRPEWAGGWYVPARTTPTATRVEGLLAAAALFRDHDRAADAARAHAAALAGIAFFCRAQHQPDDGFPNWSRAQGGFGETLTEEDTRIDYVQHAISALLAAHRWERK